MCFTEPEEDEFIHLDPDDCPSLVEGAKILFPCLSRNVKVTEGAEAAYEAEMLERLSEVRHTGFIDHDIPVSC